MCMCLYVCMCMCQCVCAPYQASGNHAKMKEMLIEDEGQLILKKDIVTGYTALHWAAKVTREFEAKLPLSLLRCPISLSPLLFLPVQTFSRCHFCDVLSVYPHCCFSPSHPSIGHVISKRRDHVSSRGKRTPLDTPFDAIRKSGQDAVPPV